MELLKRAFDYVMHVNVHLAELVNQYGLWVYAILFLIVFLETGVVVTPFLPGDSLLFAVGALCAISALNLYVAMLLLCVAAVGGDSLNYWIGHWFGPKVFSRKDSWLLNQKHLERAHAFYESYGGKAIVIARFAPILRTFAPFVAGIARMHYPRFMLYNVTGGVVWVVGFTLAGYFFGNIPIIKRNFSVVILVIIFLSLLPAVWEVVRARRAKKI